MLIRAFANQRFNMKKEKLNYNINICKWESALEDFRQINTSLAARILFDIFLINEFEHAVLKLKNEDCVWGPVHSSVGQEAIASATTLALKKSDKFFATHRAHHQFISKAMHFVLPENWTPINGPIPDIAHETVRRALSEIMGLADGYCGGRGGSMHLRYPEAGFLGSNAIVGGGIPIATGAAFTEKYKRTGNIVVCFFGDGAINQGAFHEACNLAALWKLPLIFFLENNEYAVATGADDACSVKPLVIRASSYGMSAHIVNGTDPLSIYNAVKQSADEIRKGSGPVFIEAKCYRRYHHAGDQPGSSYHYRNEQEEKEQRDREVIVSFPRILIENGIFSSEQIEIIKQTASKCVAYAIDKCTSAGTLRKVPLSLYPNPDTVSEGQRSDGREWAGIIFSEREQFNSFEEMRYSDAIARVTGRWLEKDPNVIVLGEEVANFGGGAYGATKGLPDKFPGRVLNTPISEAGFTGLGLGAAMTGMRPVIEIMFPDFSLVAADQLFNQIGKARHMYGNTTDLPLVVRTRIAMGCGYGAQHSMDPVGLYSLFPGWRIIAPSNAFDYIGLFNSAMQSLDPVLIMEHHSLYNRKMPVVTDNFDYFIEFCKARIVASGTDVTIIAYSSMALRCENLLPKFNDAGVSAELIDLRTVDSYGIDYETIGRSLKKTGAAIIVEEAYRSHAIGHALAAKLTERFFDYLDSPIISLTSLDVPTPVSRILEKAVLISDEIILDITTRVAKRL